MSYARYFKICLTLNVLRSLYFKIEIQLGKLIAHYPAKVFKFIYTLIDYLLESK